MASETLASIEKFLDSEGPDKILALANSSGAVQQIARDLSQVAANTNEITSASIDMSAAFNLSGQQIQVLSPLLLELAGLMGKDIPEASLAFWEAMQIGAIEPLKAFGLIVDESIFKTDTFGISLDILSARAIFASQVMGEIFVGQLAVLNDALNETGVIISEGLIPKIEYLAPLLAAAARDLERISAAPVGNNFAPGASGGTNARDVIGTIADVLTIFDYGRRGIRGVRGLLGRGRGGKVIRGLEEFEGAGGEAAEGGGILARGGALLGRALGGGSRALSGAGGWLAGSEGLFGGAVSWGAGATTAGIGLAMYGAVHGYDYWATRKLKKAEEEASKPAPAFLPAADNSFDLSAAGVGNSGAFDSATEWLLPNGGKDYYSGFDMPQMSQYSPRVILQRNGQGDYTIKLTSDLPIAQEWFDQQVEGFADQMAVAPAE